MLSPSCRPWDGWLSWLACAYEFQHCGQHCALDMIKSTALLLALWGVGGVVVLADRCGDAEYDPAKVIPPPLSMLGRAGN